MSASCDPTAAAEKTLTCPQVEITVTPLPDGLALALPPAPTIFTEDPEPPAASRWPWLLLLAPQQGGQGETDGDDDNDDSPAAERSLAPRAVAVVRIGPLVANAHVHARGAERG